MEGQDVQKEKLFTPGWYRMVREHWGLTREQMSTMIGLSPQMWSFYENGRGVPNRAAAMLVKMSGDVYCVLHMLETMPKYRKDAMGESYDKVYQQAKKDATRMESMVLSWRRKLSRTWVTEPWLYNQRRKTGKDEGTKSEASTS